MALVFGDKVVNARYILWVTVRKDYVSRRRMVPSPGRFLHVEFTETKVFAVVVTLVDGSKLVHEFDTLEEAEHFKSEIVDKMTRCKQPELAYSQMTEVGEN